MTAFDAHKSPAVPSPGRFTSDAVLVLRALGLGDALAGIPALRGIRRRWPDRFITLAAGRDIGCWLKDLGVVDEVLPTQGLTTLTWPPPGWIGIGGHIAVDLHGKGPLSHRLLSSTAPDELIAFRCRRAGHLSGPPWRSAEHEVDRWCRLIRSTGGSCDADDLRLPNGASRSGKVVLHPGAASASRRWPADRWSWLARRLVRSGHPITITGGAAEARMCSRIAENALLERGLAADITVEAGTLDLRELTTAIGRAALLVSGDTGVAHLATALGTPSVLLFGPTPPQYWGPAIDHDLHTVLWHGELDRPGDPHGDTIDPDLAAITGPEVLAAAEDMLANCYAGSS